MRFHATNWHPMPCNNYRRLVRLQLNLMEEHYIFDDMNRRHLSQVQHVMGSSRKEIANAQGKNNVLLCRYLCFINTFKCTFVIFALQGKIVNALKCILFILSCCIIA